MNKKEHKQYFRRWSELNARDKVVVLMAIIASGGCFMFLAGVYRIIGLIAVYSATGTVLALALLNWLDTKSRSKKNVQ